MFPFKKKKPIIAAASYEPAPAEVDNKQQTAQAISASKAKISKIEESISKEEKNRGDLYKKQDALKNRAGELEMAIAHGNKILEVNGENPILRNQITVAERELEENRGETKRVVADLQRVVSFLETTTGKVSIIKERIANLETDLSSLSLMDLEASIDIELNETDSSIRSYRQEIYTKEAMATLQ